jgi:hypothetical protein
MVLNPKKPKNQEKAAETRSIIDLDTATKVPDEFMNPTDETLNQNQTFEGDGTSGITVGGRTFLGISRKDQELLAQRELAKRQTPLAQIQQEGYQQQALQQQAVAQQQVFDRIAATPTELKNIDREGNVVENIGTAAAALGGGLLGAKAGAATGAFLAPFTGGASVPVGAAIGAIGGAIGGAFIKISAQERADVKKANKVFTTSKTNQNEILNMVNAGIISNSQAVELWEDEKLNIYSVEANLKKRTTSDLQDFLSDAGDELAAVEARVRLQPYLDTEFQLALVNPDPNKIRQSGTFSQTIGE